MKNPSEELISAQENSFSGVGTELRRSDEQVEAERCDLDGAGAAARECVAHLLSDPLGLRVRVLRAGAVVLVQREVIHGLMVAKGRALLATRACLVCMLRNCVGEGRIRDRHTKALMEEAMTTFLMPCISAASRMFQLFMTFVRKTMSSVTGSGEG